MSLHGLMEGTCCAVVLVECYVDAVAASLGIPVSLYEEGELLESGRPHGVSASVSQPAGQRWCVVEYSTADPAPTPRAPDASDRLLVQAMVVRDGQVPDVPLDRATQVSLAALISYSTGAPAVALWGSDAEPGLAGAALLEDGDVRRACSAASPASLEQMARARAAGGQGVCPAEVTEYARATTFGFTAGGGGQDLPGHVALHVDRALQTLGAPLELLAGDPPSVWERRLLNLADGATCHEVDAFYYVVGEPG